MITIEPAHLFIYLAAGMLFASYILSVSSIPKTARNACILAAAWPIWLVILVMGMFQGSDDD